MEHKAQSAVQSSYKISQRSKNRLQKAHSRLDSTELMAEHQRIVKILEQKLKKHLSWSLDQVRTRGDAQPSLSDSNSVIPDIWVEKLSTNPMQTKQVFETVLVVAVIDHLAEKDKQHALKACLEIEGLQELVLINMKESTLELLSRNEEGWDIRLFKDIEVVTLASVEMKLNMGDLWTEWNPSSKYGCKAKSAKIVVKNALKSNEHANQIVQEFPYRPELKALESGRGYLIRLSDELAYQSPIMITKLVGAKIKGIDNVAVLNRLARLLRHSEYKLKHHFYHAVEGPESYNKRMYFGHSISAYHLNLHNPRVCTACLAEEQVCSAQWDINLVAVCPYHGCELIDVCPMCKKPLVWHRPSVQKCICGFNLSEGQLKSAHPLIMDVTKAIYRAIQGKIDEKLLPTDLPPRLSVLSLPSLLKVIQFLGAAFNSELKRKNTPIYARNNLQQGIEILETAGLVLSSWPNNFHEELRKINNNYLEEDISKKNLISVFGSVYRSLYNEFKENEFDFLRIAFEEFLNKEWTGLYRSGSMSNSSTKIHSQWLTLNQASSLIDGIGDKGLRKLYEVRAIKGISEKIGETEQATIWLERASLEEYLADLNKWMPRKEVEPLLGLNLSSLVALGVAGIYKYEKGRVSSSERRSLLFEAEIVKKIIHAFEKYDVPIVQYERPTKEQAALQHALPNFLGSEKGLPKVIEAVLGGKLIPIARAGKFLGIKDFIFDTKLLRTYRPIESGSTGGEYLSMRELVNQLGIHQSYAIALVRNGFLGPSAKCESSTEKSISMKYVRLFKQKYIFAYEIANKCGAGTQWVVGYFRSLGIKATILKFKNGNKSYLYSNTQLARIDIPTSQDESLLKLKEWITSVQQKGGINSKRTISRKKLTVEQIQALPKQFEYMPDPRKGKARNHKFSVALGMIAGAKICGAKSPSEIVRWIKDLEPTELDSFGCRKVGERHLTPSSSFINDLINKIDLKKFDNTMRQLKLKFTEAKAALTSTCTPPH